MQVVEVVERPVLLVDPSVVEVVERPVLLVDPSVAEASSAECSKVFEEEVASRSSINDVNGTERTESGRRRTSVPAGIPTQLAGLVVTERMIWNCQRFSVCPERAPSCQCLRGSGNPRVTQQDPISDSGSLSQ